ncbi:flavin reductase family protein [Niabella yanshanensis]|uniref:Flavin reductase family protein n=1 Tax=Niabella yanshanensis TaxID=577386 RepID=A0ABZ0W7D5_9BACT|nr:flavin reductase family protein [Niabella yanshanensis]WQD37976.1 flavin reductase family protein [Niabella yanshanensis]
MILDLQQLSTIDKQYYLQHIIAPRPICFASTIDKAGRVNLSPFSFFNLFSTDPAIVVFSPSRRVRDNTIKHTLENVLEVPEVAINIVDYDMVQQTSLASCEYGKDISEFEKAGFAMQPAQLISPPLVKESKAKMECKVLEVKSLGDKGGAGNLVICEVLQIHLDESIVDGNGRIDQRKLKHVARLGGNWYCKVDETNLFEVEKPNVKLGIGFDALPESIRNSKVLTGNDLGILANVEILPQQQPEFSDTQFNLLLANATDRPEAIHQYAARLIAAGKIAEAWQVLLRSTVTHL